MKPAQLEIDSDKLTLYLLNLSHPEGGSKAKFFISRGFDPSQPQVLAMSLFEHATAGWPGTVISVPYGRKHVISAPMPLPDGSVRDVLAVWTMGRGSGTANFVTARPD